MGWLCSVTANLYSSEVGSLVKEIVSREPLVKHRSEQLGKLISSEYHFI